jgi:hypothetical protein
LTETSLCDAYLYFNGKFHERRTVGRPRLRWEDFRREYSLRLNVGGWRIIVAERNI